MWRCAGTLLGLLLAGAAAAGEPGPRECAVWNRELAFATTTARHDAAAFAEMIDVDAVFGISTPRPLVGRVAIAKAWAGIVVGKGIRLRWYPTTVAMPPTADIAWSTGPALLELIDANGQVTPKLSTYTSVWRRNADGQWRVVLDDGTPPTPATPAQVQSFLAGQTQHCNED